MNYWHSRFPRYVSVAERRANAQRELTKLKKKGRAIVPVVIKGRTIASSFWGDAWCRNLEHYSDYANRLPRGRSYVRNGSVVDLAISRGKVEALVSGSSLYRVNIAVRPVKPAQWKTICADCAGSIGSLVELLQGQLSENVMERVCRPGDGLFPTPRDIELSCSCPDWAGMCKHVAAVLYGVGARLDSGPELLFHLRGVDHAELIGDLAAGMATKGVAAASERILEDDDMAALFGVELMEQVAPPVPAKTRRATVRPDGAGRKKKTAGQTKRRRRGPGKPRPAKSAGGE